jgi:hypothetical protein
LAKLTRPAATPQQGNRRSPRKEPQSNFIRNKVALLLPLPVEFEINLSIDRTKITDEEWFEIAKKAQADAAEAYIRREAEKDPNGHYATTYFMKADANL